MIDLLDIKKRSEMLRRVAAVEVYGIRCPRTPVSFARDTFPKIVTSAGLKEAYAEVPNVCPAI